MAQIIGRDEVPQLASDGAVLVEVLPPKAYEQFHLCGALNFPLATLDAKSAARLPRERAVVVYCYDFQ